MTEMIQKFVYYMKEVRKTSENTTVSYERDLRKMSQYFEEQGIDTEEADAENILEASEVFEIGDGRYLIVEG